MSHLMDGDASSLVGALRLQAQGLSDLADSIEASNASIERNGDSLKRSAFGFEDNGSAIGDVELAALARIRYWERRQRATYFDESIFGEPAWDILLDIFYSDVVGKRLSVSSVCGASSVAFTTALRCIANLEKGGLLQRESDTKDARVQFVSLSGRCRASMREYLKELFSGGRFATERRKVSNARFAIGN